VEKVYERAFGLAHAIGTPVILITQNQAYVPFDLRHNRYIEYEYPSRAIKSFKRRLANALTETLKLEPQRGSNVSGESV
jgi:hypothetical protein